MPPPGDGSGGRREGVRMRFKRAGLLTKVVVMVLLIYMATALLDLHGQIQTIQVEREELNQQVAAQQLENQQLANAIENSDDPDMLESVARDKGYVKSGRPSTSTWPTDHPGNGLRGKFTRRIYQSLMEFGVGSIVDGKVTGITKFGAFVALPEGDPAWSTSLRSLIPM